MASLLDDECLPPLPSVLQSVPKDILEDFLTPRLRLFGARLARALVPNAGPQDVDLALSKALAAKGGDAEPVAPQNLALRFKHNCRFLGCTNRACTLCKNNPYKQCAEGDSFCEYYADNQALKSKCEADVYVELYQPETGAPVATLSNVEIQVSIVDGESVQDPVPLGFRGAVELLKCEQGQNLMGSQSAGGLLDPSGRLNLRLQPSAPASNPASLIGASIVRLPDVYVTDKNDTYCYRGSTTPTFRLMAVAVVRDAGGRATPLASIAPGYSPKFTVKTQRAINDYSKHDYPYHGDIITKVKYIGTISAQRLLNVHEHVGKHVPIVRVETVAQLKELLEFADKHRDVEAKLVALLNMKGKHKHKWEYLKEVLANRIVYDDAQPRAWFPPAQGEAAKEAASGGGLQLQGLLFSCKQGHTYMDKPLGLLQRAGLQPSGRWQVVSNPQDPAQQALMAAWRAQAEAAWRSEEHRGWVVMVDMMEIADPSVWIMPTGANLPTPAAAQANQGPQPVQVSNPVHLQFLAASQARQQAAPAPLSVSGIPVVPAPVHSMPLTPSSQQLSPPVLRAISGTLGSSGTGQLPGGAPLARSTSGAAAMYAALLQQHQREQREQQGQGQGPQMQQQPQQGQGQGQGPQMQQGQQQQGQGQGSQMQQQQGQGQGQARAPLSSPRPGSTHGSNHPPSDSSMTNNQGAGRSGEMPRSSSSVLLPALALAVSGGHAGGPPSPSPNFRRDGATGGAGGPEGEREREASAPPALVGLKRAAASPRDHVEGSSSREGSPEASQAMEGVEEPGVSGSPSSSSYHSGAQGAVAAGGSGRRPGGRWVPAAWEDGSPEAVAQARLQQMALRGDAEAQAQQAQQVQQRQRPHSLILQGPQRPLSGSLASQMPLSATSVMAREDQERVQGVQEEGQAGHVHKQARAEDMEVAGAGAGATQGEPRKRQDPEVLAAAQILFGISGVIGGPESPSSGAVPILQLGTQPQPAVDGGEAAAASLPILTLGSDPSRPTPMLQQLQLQQLLQQEWQMQQAQQVAQAQAQAAQAQAQAHQELQHQRIRQALMQQNITGGALLAPHSHGGGNGDGGLTSLSLLLQAHQQQQQVQQHVVPERLLLALTNNASISGGSGGSWQATLAGGHDSPQVAGGLIGLLQQQHVQQVVPVQVAVQVPAVSSGHGAQPQNLIRQLLQSRSAKAFGLQLGRGSEGQGQAQPSILVSQAGLQAQQRLRPSLLDAMDVDAEGGSEGEVVAMDAELGGGAARRGGQGSGGGSGRLGRH